MHRACVATMELYTACVRGQALLQRRAAQRAILAAWWQAVAPHIHARRRMRLVRRLAGAWALQAALTDRFHSRRAWRHFGKKWAAAWYLIMQARRACRGKPVFRSLH